jgi:HlyD family secretion protein
VVQVRRAPITVQNVVTYDVVIGVDNPELLLFPGMTANARIIVDEHRGVATMPTQALRFDPRESRTAGDDSTAPSPDGQRVWVLRGDRPVPIAVTAGLDDGTHVEIAGGALALGDRVIVDEAGGAGRNRGDSQVRPPFRF